MNKYDSAHSADMPLEAEGRPGPRSWGKFHHMLHKANFLKHQPLHRAAHAD